MTGEGGLPTGGSAAVILTKDAAKRQAACGIPEIRNRPRGSEDRGAGLRLHADQPRTTGPDYLGSFYKENPDWTTSLNSGRSPSPGSAIRRLRPAHLWDEQKVVLSEIMRGQVTPDQGLASLVELTTRLGAVEELTRDRETAREPAGSRAPPPTGPAIMSKIIQLSDLHLCPEGERVVGFDPAARLSTVLEALRRDHPDAGPLPGQRRPHRPGRRGLLSTAPRRACGFSRSAVPDAGQPRPPRAVSPRLSRRLRRRPAGFVQGAVDLDGGRLVFLDTLDEDFPSAGRLCARRLAWLDATLRRSRTRRRSSHSTIRRSTSAWTYFRFMLLADGAAFEAVLDRHPQVVHLAFGHVHVPCSADAWALLLGRARTCHPMLPPFPAWPPIYVERPPSYELILFAGEAVVLPPHASPAARKPGGARGRRSRRRPGHAHDLQTCPGYELLNDVFSSDLRLRRRARRQ